MIRRFEVEMTTTVTLEIDDEIVSELDGDTILTRHENTDWQDAYYGDIGRDRSLMDIAIQVGVDGRAISSVDGWADFPKEAVRSIGWPQWDPGSLTVREVVTRPGLTPTSTPEEG